MFSFFFSPAGPEPFLHLPVIQCDLVECWWVLLLCCGHRCHVSHLHSYLSVHYQKGEFHNSLAVLHVNSYKDLTALLVLYLFPAIRYAPWYGGNSQYCPCVCMPSQWWFVCFFNLLKDGFYRVALKCTSVTILSCSVACFSKEYILYKTYITLLEYILL